SNIFRVMTDNGYRTVLSPKYASEISRLPNLSFGKIMSTEFHAWLPGFDPFFQFDLSDTFQKAVRMKLTQALGRIAKPLSDEASHALKHHWTDNPEWHEFPLKPTILQIVAQLSSRVFLGEKICRDPDWLRITVDYTVESFRANEELRTWPDFLRPFVARFPASCVKVRASLRGAREIITPVLEERRRNKQSALEKGQTEPRYNDAMEWMEQTSKGRPYDHVAVQLTFSVSAIHTTSDMMTQALYDLCTRPGLVEALRKEIIEVISTDGWKKTAMYKLQLMDSFLKESQRMKPINLVSMRRIAEDNIRLSDGTQIAKGTSIMVAGEWMRDAQFYEDPETFDAYRFLKMRQIPGNQASAQFVSPSPEHLGFGFGNHACPGRFFVANEIKIAMCHILLKYDLKLAEGSVPQYRRYGFSNQADPLAQISARRRREEIALEEISG
ncbi:hypothetical protein N7512_003192, partial [Penicillium capsulatum]